jgi:predicted small secreted protein
MAWIESKLRVADFFHIMQQDRRYTMFQRILATLMLLGMLGTIAGCNTMHGFGKDVERAGEKVQEKAAR